MGASEPFRHFPGRANAWQLQTRTLHFGERPLVMGILNVTPDSFSDGGKFLDHGAAVAQGLKLLHEGADILDIGGESTRPYSAPVPAEEELRRVGPVIGALRSERPDAVLSIDTSKASVAEACLAAGAEIINDVTGFDGDPRMIQVALAHDAAVCAMHMRGTPQTMQDNPQYADVVQEVCNYLQSRRDRLIAAGIDRRRICLDPGIGFGKTHEHNIELMANCWRLHALGCPLLVGHSRKGFLGKLIGDKDGDRTAATLGGSLALAVQGVQILRVHDVRATRESLSAFVACGGIFAQAES
jgi:dihydropteroate synthase